MQNKKIYYKLTTHKNQSFIVHNINVLSIKYTPNQWVKAPYAKSGYGIHVFETLHHTKLFLKDVFLAHKNGRGMGLGITSLDLSYINLWEVYIKNKINFYPRLLCTLLPKMSEQQFFDEITAIQDINHSYLYPQGTILAEQVKLLKLLDINKELNMNF